MLADELDYVIGVDTHRDEHVLAVVTAPAGAVVARRAIGADGRGYREALRFAERGRARAGGRGRSRARGSYGAGLARSLSEHGEAVLEISRTPRTRAAAGRQRRLARRGPDRLGRRSPARRSRCRARGERREALRLLLIARRSAVDVRREALTQLRAVIVTAPEPLREELRRLPLGKLLDRCSRLRRTGRSRRARDPARPAQPRPPHPGSDQRSRRARAGDPHPCPRTRPGTARRARRRPDRRRPTDRRLVTPRPAPLRSLLRPPRRRRPDPRLAAARQPGTGSAAAATANSTAPCTRSSSTAANTTPPPATTSPAASRRQINAATPPASSSATSPATSTGYSKTRAADDLTSHRSFIPEYWRRRRASRSCSNAAAPMVDITRTRAEIARRCFEEEVMKRLLASVAGVGALVAATAAFAAPSSTATARLVYVTSPVSAGAHAILVARVHPARRCTITVYTRAALQAPRASTPSARCTGASHGRGWSGQTRRPAGGRSVRCGSAGSFRTHFRVR